MAADRPVGQLTSSRGRGAVVGLSVVLVLLLAAAGVLGWQVYRYRAEEGRRQEILAAARQMVVNFTTLDYQHGRRDLDRVLEASTGDFKQEFSARAPQLEQLVKENKTVSKGQVLEAGIVSHDDDSARVLVVADSTVTNKAVPQGQERHYRIQLDLRREGDRWLTSSLEFVG